MGYCSGKGCLWHLGIDSLLILVMCRGLLEGWLDPLSVAELARGIRPCSF